MLVIRKATIFVIYFCDTVYFNFKLINGYEVLWTYLPSCKKHLSEQIYWFKKAVQLCKYLSKILTIEVKICQDVTHLSQSDPFSHPCTPWWRALLWKPADQRFLCQFLWDNCDVFFSKVVTRHDSLNLKAPYSRKTVQGPSVLISFPFLTTKVLFLKTTLKTPKIETL